MILYYSACNNPDSVTAAENAGVERHLIATAVNDATVTSVIQGLTRDFTFGTEFRGVTTFDTQGYFAPPSGTTEQRDISLQSGRGSFSAGTSPNDSPSTNNIDYISYSKFRRFTRFWRFVPRSTGRICRIRFYSWSLCGGSATPGATNVNTISYITIATTGSSTNFGDTVQM